jgi:hypothetical protein
MTEPQAAGVQADVVLFFSSFSYVAPLLRTNSVHPAVWMRPQQVPHVAIAIKRSNTQRMRENPSKYSSPGTVVTLRHARSSILWVTYDNSIFVGLISLNNSVSLPVLTVRGSVPNAAWLRC